MKLEQLRERLKELETGITNTTNSFHILLGHKQEIEFHIKELLKLGISEVEEPMLDQPVVNSVENPVE